MISESATCPRTYETSACSIREISGLPAVRREAPVDGSRQPLHVEEHVDRDDEDQHEVEERLADRDRRALDEVDDPVRVPPDVALADALHEPVAALLDLDALQVVGVEPVLEPVDVAVGRGSVRA